ncbi:MAG TPA: BON domain-containing protein [Gammaproteobacteria bacterium]|nr:BON domain-containing protein [Gammaproteobacteria bacterium]
MKSISTLLLISLALTTFYGCAPMVVGGAAASGSALHDRRTVGTFIDDEGIELKSRLAILENKELNSQIHINIISVNGVALMVGQAPTETLRQQAQGIVAATEKIRMVHNEMSIAAPNSLMTRSSDTLITAKVKTALFNIKGLDNFDPTRVKVVTEDGIVYLMGLLYRNEADAVSDQARQVSGVEKIVKVFEYLD